MRPIALSFVAVTILAGPAVAQTERLGAPSRVERDISATTRSIQRQREVVQDRQQTQFELNQLRIQRDRIPQTYGTGNPSCPPGAIGC